MDIEIETVDVLDGLTRCRGMFFVLNVPIKQQQLFAVSGYSILQALD